MGLTAIECPDGVCHSHHGGHAVERNAMEKLLADPVTSPEKCPMPFEGQRLIYGSFDVLVER